MVHLTPDSRLLVSLVKQEQAYAAQLHSLLNTSGTSLSALVVYASSSPPNVSPVLNGVAGAFSGAHEAFRTYGEALNDWIDQLGRIKQKEEEVANIGRDREILVTRLLKASQKSKSPPPSLLYATPDHSSSTSLSTFNSKINNAQGELRACESRLADKERELENVRLHAIRHGLELRCGALAQCGQVWSEMGRRALDMLSELNVTRPSSNGHATEFFKPLPDPTHDHDRDSVLSSLTPSQSASQIGHGTAFSASFPPEKHYRLELPPPHLVPDAVIPQTSGGEGSSTSEEEGPLEVIENPRFKQTSTLGKYKKNTWSAPPTPARQSPVPFPGASSDLGSSKKLKHGEKRRSRLFGSIAALFRTSMTPKIETRHDSAWTRRKDRHFPDTWAEGESSDEEDARPVNGSMRKGKDRLALPPFDHVLRAQTSERDDAAQLSHLGVSTIAPRSKRTGKLGRSGTVRSTVSEPPPIPRQRANTMSAVYSGSAVGGSVRVRGRLASSIDGRRSLDTASLQAWKPPKTKGESLMKIMEGPLAGADDDPASRLEVVRAPGSAVPRLPLLIHPPPPLVKSSSAPSSPVVAKASAAKRASMPVPTMNAPGILVAPPPPIAGERKPLRSAMRKSPSPSASPNIRAAADDQSPTVAPLTLSTSASLSPKPRPVSLTRPEIPSTIIESPCQSLVDTQKTDDTASISTYETGHESMDGEVTAETGRAPGVTDKDVPPSPQVPALRGTALSDKQEISSATSADTASAPPARRKSVRMSSLPPQVSVTPPALDEYNDADHPPWSNHSQPDDSSKWRTRIPTYETTMSWEDSSSEDETYKAAKQALTRADRPSQRRIKGGSRKQLFE